MNEATFVITNELTKSKCEEPCEGRLSSTVPREGWVKFPPLTRQVKKGGCDAKDI